VHPRHASPNLTPARAPAGEADRGAVRAPAGRTGQAAIVIELDGIHAAGHRRHRHHLDPHRSQLGANDFRNGRLDFQRVASKFMSLFGTVPSPGISIFAPNRLLMVCVVATTFPIGSAAAMCVTDLPSLSDRWRAPRPVFNRNCHMFDIQTPLRGLVIRTAAISR
jgi:hypothetical protein